MSTLSSQVNSLRLMARLVRDYDYKEISRMLREAADTIESLRDRLQAVGETCELTAFAGVPFSVDYEFEGYDISSTRDYAALAECSKCGAYVIVPPAHHHVLTYDGDEVYQPYRYCPNCRREVVGE